MSDIVYNDRPPAKSGGEAPGSANNPDIRDDRGHPGNPVYGDVAAALPAPVRKKFKRLRGEAEHARRAFEALSQNRTELMQRVTSLEDQFAALTMRVGERSHHGYEGHGLDEDSGEVRTTKLQLASLREDLEEITAKYSDRNNGVVAGLVSNLDDFIRSRRLFSLARPTEPTLRKGDTLPSAIEGRRRRIAELKADLGQVERAPWPSALTKARARNELEELAKRGRVDVFGLVERGHAIVWPTLPKFDDKAPLLDTKALMAWALGPTLVSAVEREIDELSDDDKALTAEQRKQRTEEVRAEILAVEREEEELIELAEAQLLPVIRRTDADPRAVLGVS
jgi:hypothetical protein